mgnify:CR=1 FL=1
MAFGRRRSPRAPVQTTATLFSSDARLGAFEVVNLGAGGLLLLLHLLLLHRAMEAGLELADDLIADLETALVPAAAHAK